MPKEAWVNGAGRDDGSAERQMTDELVGCFDCCCVRFGRSVRQRVTEQKGQHAGGVLGAFRRIELHLCPNLLCMHPPLSFLLCSYPVAEQVCITLMV